MNLKKIFLSGFSAWMLFALLSCYYLLPNLFVSGAENRFAMSRLKLGIDLQGGTYITLGVEVEKALENRLGGANRDLDNMFKAQDFKSMPKTKEINKSKLSMEMSFDDSENAKICYNFIKENLPIINPELNGKKIVATLSPAEDTRIRNNSVEQAVHVISSRVSGLGVEGTAVQRHGSRQIVIQLPGVDNPDRVKNLITKRAHLEFKIIEDVASSKDILLDKFDGDLPSDRMIIPGERATAYEDDETEGTWYLTSAFPDLTGDHIIESKVSYGEMGQPVVAFKLDKSGGRAFKELTRNNLNKRLGIIIDNVVYTAPNISAEIGSQGVITGNKSFEIAKDLSIVLNTGAFQAPVTFQEERRIGPSLGQDSIKKGLMSCLIGLGLVFIFSLIYYKVAGFLAMIALVYNLLLILLFLSYFKATLTLAGIAGITLTIGMAIDASILIYERIKELLAEGMTFRTAVDVGFKKAIVVILDSNITTFLTGLVLFYFGGPSIRGFAITLMAGILATVIAGVFFLKSMMVFVLDSLEMSTIKL